MGWHGRSRGRSRDYGSYMGFAPYVPVAERQARAAKEAAKLTGKGHVLQPIRLAKHQIATTFWGRAWCANLEAYSDFANRLPRGRSYVRNGSVLHLEIGKGQIEALVSGSALYKIKIGIKPVAPARWTALCRECAGGIGSLMELLAGRLSERVMGVMTAPGNGLFPTPSEIALDCSCPDWADMCKHVAAVLYGVGARLDEKPELLFTLRHVDHNDLVTQASTVEALTAASGTAQAATLDAADVSDVFGIELAVETPPPAKPAARTGGAAVTPAGVPSKPKRTPRPAKGKPEAKPAPRQVAKKGRKPVRKATKPARPRPAAKARKTPGVRPR